MRREKCLELHLPGDFTSVSLWDTKKAVPRSMEGTLLFSPPLFTPLNLIPIDRSRLPWNQFNIFLQGLLFCWYFTDFQVGGKFYFVVYLWISLLMLFCLSYLENSWILYSGYSLAFPEPSLLYLTWLLSTPPCPLSFRITGS